MNQVFIPNRIYKRREELHYIYGGSYQGGITPCKNYPYIFIFSGKGGQQHGYQDMWVNENIFSYSGEGQVGDMKFTKGNLAIREQLKSGKRIFLFTQTIKGFVKFETELDFYDFDYIISADREGNDRVAINFFFKRTGANVNYDFPRAETISKENREEYIVKLPNVTERKGLVTSRVGQGAYRKSILYRWEFKCAVTNYSKKEILIASHIVPWNVSTDNERLDVHNGILLSPTYDALFDKQLISFEDSGKIILSTALSKTNYQDIGVTGREKIKNFSVENHHYLDRHRALIDV